uniref:Uncharacterized protein n=1 Tax=Salmo trutta TaxID=8032 RepID=A0A674BDJ3_SALTR
KTVGPCHPSSGLYTGLGSPFQLDKMATSTIVGHADNTVKQTKWERTCFTDWCAGKGIHCEVWNATKAVLNFILRDFYGSVRNVNGDEYGISNYAGLRSGLNQHINDPPLSLAWSIQKDTEFTTSNNVFVFVIKNAALDTETPEGLVNKVWLDVQINFGRKGKEGNSLLKSVQTRMAYSMKFTFSMNQQKTTRTYKRRTGKVEGDACLNSVNGIIWYVTVTNTLATMLPKICKIHKSLPPNRHDPETIGCRASGTITMPVRGHMIQKRSVAGLERHDNNVCQRTQIRNLSSKLLEAKSGSEEAVENGDNTAAASPDKRTASIIQQRGANKRQHEDNNKR